jgi:Flp pilus assembly protein TadD
MWFDKALEVDPEDVHVLTLKGSVLYDLGKKADALIWIDKALVLDPNSQRAIDAKSSMQG